VVVTIGFWGFGGLFAIMLLYIPFSILILRLL